MAVLARSTPRVPPRPTRAAATTQATLLCAQLCARGYQTGATLGRPATGHPPASRDANKANPRGLACPRPGVKHTDARAACDGGRRWTRRIYRRPRGPAMPTESCASCRRQPLRAARFRREPNRPPAMPGPCPHGQLPRQMPSRPWAACPHRAGSALAAEPPAASMGARIQYSPRAAARPSPRVSAAEQRSIDPAEQTTSLRVAAARPSGGRLRRASWLQGRGRGGSVSQHVRSQLQPH